jgi:anti-sigma factor RsiW
VSGLSCQELVELVTDYFEDALTPEERRHVEEHLAVCTMCTQHLNQVRVTIEAVGALREESQPPPSRDELIELFRGWKRGHSR